MMDDPLAPDASSDTLSELLGRCSPATFLKEYWERQPLHVRASGAIDPKRILTLDDLNRLFESSVFRADECKVARGGDIVPASTYIGEPGPRIMQRAAGDHVNAAALLNCFNLGATLVLAQLNHKWLPLQRLKQGLQRSLSANVVANVFLSPRHAQGFSLHYDSHDVFVLQLHGRKTWSLHDSPIPLPTKGQAFGRTGVVAGAVTQTLVLEPGDVLYVPRGVFHEAVTSNEVSLHLTLGVHPYLWVDYITDVLQEFGATCLEWRHSVPHGCGSLSQAERQAGLRDLLAGMLTSDRLEPLAAALYRDGIASRIRPGTHLVADHLEQILRADTLSADSILTLRPMTPGLGKTLRNGCLMVSACGQTIMLAVHWEPMVEAILSGRMLRIGDLPGDCALDEKLEFSRRLIGMGALAAS